MEFKVLQFLNFNALYYNIQGGPAEMRRLGMRINQSIFEIYLYLIP